MEDDTQRKIMDRFRWRKQQEQSMEEEEEAKS
jgi:hypothetical protein